MIDKLKGWRNRWVSKPVLSWLRKTGGVGPFLGGGWVHSFMVVANKKRKRGVLERGLKGIIAAILLAALLLLST